MSRGNIYSTGNAIVDENAKLNISGNIIPQAWYRTIIRDSGKPNLTAIVLLADIVYWYKPTEVRDEVTGRVVATKKKFKSDLLQRSYQQFSEQFGISKKEASNAIVFLEKLGVVKRVFRTINIDGLVVNNVLYLELIVKRLQELTYPEDRKPQPRLGTEQNGWAETGEGCMEEPRRGQAAYGAGAVPFQRGRVSPFGDGPMDSVRETNTEITHETTAKNIPEIYNTEYKNPIQSYQSTKQHFKEQIEYDVIWIDRPSDRGLLENVVSIVADVLTSTAETVRINREDKPVPVVQSIYGRLNKYSVEYVLDSIRNCGSRAANIRAVLMTALYNATMTDASNVANLFAYHTAMAQA